MAILKCTECGKRFSEFAPTCPNCGCPKEVTLQHLAKSQSEEMIHQDEANKKPKLFFSKKHRRKKILLAVPVVLAIGVLLTITAFQLKGTNANTSGEDQEMEAATEETTVDWIPDTSASNEQSLSNSPQYISDRYVDYDRTNQYHRVFFGFQNSNNAYVDVESGTISLKITNTNKEVVYEKEVPITKSDFTSWTNNFWDGSRYLGCIYVKDTDIIAGSHSTGTLTLSAAIGNNSFDSYDMPIRDLPVKKLSITFPAIPSEFSRYDYNGVTSQKIRVNSIDYSDVTNYDGSVTLTLKLNTTMTYNYNGDGRSEYGSIGYKLKDNNGTIVESGSFHITESKTGETVKTEQLIFNLVLNESYTLELLDVTY